MKVKTAIPLLAAALLLAAPLAAQDRSGTAEISLFGGGYFGGTLHAGSNALFPRDVSIGTAPAYGARIGYNVNRWFGLEFGWSQTKPDITGMGGDLLWGQGQKIGEMTHNIFEGNAVFNMGRMPLIIEALRTGDLDMLHEVVADRLHQRYRLALTPGAEEALQAAWEAGAAGAFVSGSGPSLLAFVRDDDEARDVGEAMLEEFKVAEVQASVRVVTTTNEAASISPQTSPAG